MLSNDWFGNEDTVIPRSNTQLSGVNESKFFQINPESSPNLDGNSNIVKSFLESASVQISGQLYKHSIDHTGVMFAPSRRSTISKYRRVLVEENLAEEISSKLELLDRNGERNFGIMILSNHIYNGVVNREKTKHSERYGTVDNVTRMNLVIGNRVPDYDERYSYDTNSFAFVDYRNASLMSLDTSIMEVFNWDARKVRDVLSKKYVTDGGLDVLSQTNSLNIEVNLLPLCPYDVKFIETAGRMLNEPIAFSSNEANDFRSLGTMYQINNALFLKAWHAALWLLRDTYGYMNTLLDDYKEFIICNYSFFREYALRMYQIVVEHDVMLTEQIEFLSSFSIHMQRVIDSMVTYSCSGVELASVIGEMLLESFSLWTGDMKGVPLNWLLEII